MNLSPNFTLEEMTASETAARHGIDNTPPNDVLMNLRRLALFLEEVRTVVGMPLRFSSGYRGPGANAKVGGKKNGGGGGGGREGRAGGVGAERGGGRERWMVGAAASQRWGMGEGGGAWPGKEARV